MDFHALLNELIPNIGQAGVTELANQFNDLSKNQDDAWKRASLALVADAVDKHGMEGVELAQDAIHALFNNEVPKIDWASPRTASDIVAAMQNAEADERAKALAFFVQLGDVFGQISAALLKSFIANV